MSAILVFALFDAAVLASCWTLLRLCEVRATDIELQRLHDDWL